MKDVLVVVAAVVVGASCRMAGRLPGGYGALQSTFSCLDRSFGYYADVEHKCRAFHVCQPLYTEEGTLREVAHFTFMCGMDSVFNQDSLTCAHPTDAFACDQSTALYDISNASFGVVTEDTLETRRR